MDEENNQENRQDEAAHEMNNIGMDMDEDELKNSLSQTVGDAGTFDSDEYDLSEIIVSTDETIVWMPDDRQIGLFGHDIYDDFDPIDTIRIIDQEVTEHRGEDVVEQTVYELSSSGETSIHPIPGDRVENISEALGIDEIDMLQNARIRSDGSFSVVMIDIPVGRIAITPIQYESDYAETARKRSNTAIDELEEGVGGWDKELNEDIEATNQ